MGNCPLCKVINRKYFVYQHGRTRKRSYVSWCSTLNKNPAHRTTKFDCWKLRWYHLVIGDLNLTKILWFLLVLINVLDNKDSVSVFEYCYGSKYFTNKADWHNYLKYWYKLVRRSIYVISLFYFFKKTFFY